MEFDPLSTTRFENEIARYNRWRKELSHSVQVYHDWLERTNQLDVQQSIRFFDLLENLNRGRLLLAFLAVARSCSPHDRYYFPHSNLCASGVGVRLSRGTGHFC